MALTPEQIEAMTQLKKTERPPTAQKQILAKHEKDLRTGKLTELARVAKNEKHVVLEISPKTKRLLYSCFEEALKEAASEGRVLLGEQAMREEIEKLAGKKNRLGEIFPAEGFMPSPGSRQLQFIMGTLAAESGEPTYMQKYSGHYNSALGNGLKQIENKERIVEAIVDIERACFHTGFKLTAKKSRTV